MKKTIKKLELNKTTVVVLTENQQAKIVGGEERTPPDGGIRVKTNITHK